VSEDKYLNKEKARLEKKFGEGIIEKVVEETLEKAKDVGVSSISEASEALHKVIRVHTTNKFWYTALYLNTIFKVLSELGLHEGGNIYGE
jgi:hypothetical protein